MLYPDFVENVECNPDNKNYRYYLNVCFKYSGEKQTAMIIMQNPSKADNKRSDRTVNRVLNYMNNFGYGRVIIVNLIPFYGTKIETISESNLNNYEILECNCKIISENSKLVDKIFVAWGWAKKLNSSYYRERIDRVKDGIDNSKSLYCYEINSSNGQPRHPRRWRNGKKEEYFKEFTR